MNISAFSSEKLVITVETPSTRRKIFQILFGKKDGSLFLSFPYYKHSDGFLTLATMRKGQQYPTSLSLVDGGKVTSHKVKYSHHLDGRTHFSQDKKIYTRVIKQSATFDEVDGHIFTVQFQGLKDFEGLAPDEYRSVITPKKTILNFNFKHKEPQAIKILGHCYRHSRLVPMLEGYNGEPWLRIVKPDGSISLGFIIRNSYYKSDNPLYIILYFEDIPTIDASNNSLLTLLAGFDADRISRDSNRDTQFLIMAYPIRENKLDIINRIGTVDYAAPPTFRGPAA
jgi:hypothetical protein